MTDLFDLIRKLLVKNPLERLGGGMHGSQYSISELKKHAFFADLQFDELHIRIPQVQSCKNGYNFIKVKEQFDKLEFTAKHTYTSTKHALADCIESDSSVSSSD